MNRCSMHRLAWFAMLMLLATSASVHAANVRAWLDRDTMQLGETVTLNVEAQGTSAAQPDFSALKQDFDLLGTQSSQQISIVNGTNTSKTLWAVGLQPKHEGRITIAAIAVAGASTAPIELTVLAQSESAQPQAGGDVFLDVTAQPLTPYVQQQVRYTVKLYYAFDLTNGNLGEPAADGVTVQRIGQDTSYVSSVGARRYHVIERHYALIPERSGALDIAALTFRGSALDANDPSGFFSRGRAVSARSQAIHLEVRPKPAAWTDAPWLPAASLLLKDETELPAEVHVGDPVTRTIRLQAQGLGYEQLPELTLAAPDGAEIYPDKADTRTRDDGEWLYGERVRKFAFVPNRPGKLTIPGITVRWWDTVHDRAESAQLPARVVNVLPASGATGIAPLAPAAHAARTAPAVPSTATVASKPSAPVAAPGERSLRVWQMLALLGFALWLVTLALWWRSRGPRSVAGTRKPATPGDPSAHRAAFLRACALGEFAGAERALIAWARDERADVRNLGELATRLADDAQREALSGLQRTRYAGASAHGLAGRLQKAFRHGLAWREETPRVAEPALPALYPPRR